MSLATRCPACGTIFRVVQDQLKVSEGWVRCGQCHEVFHGIEALFDLDSDPAVAARRAAARGPLAPPLTRAFADQRASAPIPMPTPAAPTAPPTAPVAIPARAPAPVTAPAPIASGPTPQSVPATPSAFGGSNHPPVAIGPRPGYTGFTPATRPLPPPPAPPAPLPAPPEAMPPPASGSTQFAPVATRGTIAPRFAARLAEEAAARAQAAAPAPTTPPSTPASPAPPPFGSALTQHAAPSVQAPMEPPPAPTIAPPPGIVPPESAPAQATSPAFAPVSVPAPPPAPAPIFAVPDDYIPPSIAANRASVFAPPPAPVVAPIPVTAPEPTSEPERAEAPLATPAPVDATPSAADLATAFAAPPSETTSTAAPSAPGDDLEQEAASEAADAPTPRHVAEDAAEAEAKAEAAAELRAGPPTLASMLPEDAGDWPPRRTKKRAANAAAPASEVALVDRSKDPRFLREAKSGARWRRPWVRAVLSATLLVLVVAAVGQVAWPQRDLLASRWPATLPAWSWLCEQADCRIEAPRAIASLALDGSSLTRTDTEHVLLFSADLHNRADHEVRMPSFDLTFMDLNGEIVARKVLTPEQIGIHRAALPAEGELHVHARLQVGSLPASGFQADLFYP